MLYSSKSPQNKEKTMELEIVDEDLFRFEISYDAALCRKRIKTFYSLVKFILHHVNTWKFNLMVKKINLR